MTMKKVLFLGSRSTNGVYKLMVLAMFMFSSFYGNGQSCSGAFTGGALNWSALSWTCGGGGSAPTTTGTYTESLTVGTISTGDNLIMNITFTLNGTLTVSSSGADPTITIPAGVTVIINGDFLDNDNNVRFAVDGTLIVTGKLKAKNSAVFSGSGSISGGELELGNGPSCSGSCPGLSFDNCNSGDPSFCANVTDANTYTWDGSSDATWTNSANWTPARNIPATSDVLIFSASGLNKNITGVPSQSVGKIMITGSSTYSFATSSSQALTLTSLENQALTIDNGSTLTIGTGNALGITLPSGGGASIGGQLNLFNGTLTANTATLLLHTNSAPLATTSGRVTMNASSILQFGASGLTTGSTIVLPASIFTAAPTISSMVVNRTNGATLSNQPITVTTATFTLGDLNTNTLGRLKFSLTATSPTESGASKIIGYAEMVSRAVGMGAVDFLGMSVAAGTNDVGSMTIVRRTGPGHENVFNSNESISVSWDVTATTNPAAGRSVLFRWLPAFDNNTISTLRFQKYFYNGGPGWTSLGTLQLLTATTPLRTTAASPATDLNDTFTVTDETQTLPITLVRFTAKPVKEGVQLDWSTATEENFDYFAVEHSIDGISFTEFAQQKGQENSKITRDYSIVHAAPVYGKNYYRLRSVDLDGSNGYSKLVMVMYDGGKYLMVFPNPTTPTHVQYKANFEINEMDRISIVSPLGTEVAYGTADAGDQLIRFSTELRSGIYLLYYSGKEFKTVTRMVVK
jgi:hypothetical protein